jgi:hypothetical protein
VILSSAPGFLCAALSTTIDQRVVLPVVRSREEGIRHGFSVLALRRRRPLRMQATGTVQCPIPRTRELRPSVVCWERRGQEQEQGQSLE